MLILLFLKKQGGRGSSLSTALPTTRGCCWLQEQSRDLAQKLARGLPAVWPERGCLGSAEWGPLLAFIGGLWLSCHPEITEGLEPLSPRASQTQACHVRPGTCFKGTSHCAGRAGRSCAPKPGHTMASACELHSEKGLVPHGSQCHRPAKLHFPTQQTN